MKPILRLADVDVELASTSKQKVEGGDAGVSAYVFKAGVSTQTTTATNRSGFDAAEVTASWVAEKVAALPALFLIDEIDSLNNVEDKRRIAEFVKLLSDARSKLKVVLVGIAETSAELTAGHPSVQRCLRETRLGRMTSSELREIIESGQKTLGLNFSEAAINRIVSVSSGCPHFTHLLALKASEDALAEDRINIDVGDIEFATRRAVEDAEGSLRRSYDLAARSAGTDEYKRILLAAALCKAEEIVANELRSSYEKLHGVAISQNSLNNYFKRLISDDDSSIMRRIAQGVYRFSDPRMPSYVRIAQSHLDSDDLDNAPE